MPIEKVDISRILVNNKYRLPVTEFDTAVYVVDIPKASQLILDLINKELYAKEEGKQGRCEQESGQETKVR